MKVGGDFLGGKNYQRALLAATRQGDAGGIFLRTFGDARATVEAMAKSGKFSDIVVHLAAFDGTHAYPVKKLLPQLREDAKWLNGVSVRFPKTVFLLSPFCEHNHPAAVMKPLFDELRRLAPACLMLNSIWKGQQVPGVITEIHLTDSKRLPKKPSGEYTVAWDGFGGDGSGDFPDADVPTILQHYADARHIRYWNFRCNGKFGHADKTPVNARKVWADVHYLKGHRAMMEAREGKATWTDRHGLYKPFSDDHGGGTRTKDNKAMCILPGVDKPSVEVKDLNGKVIALMARFRPDHTNEPKGPRYYSVQSAYQLGDVAMANTGSRQIVIANRPPTDADLRSGRFR